LNDMSNVLPVHRFFTNTRIQLTDCSIMLTSEATSNN